MKNSTKTPKKLGPIRTGAVVPSLIIFALIYTYFALFFDGNLRRGLQYVATQANGAEVNIGNISTSFLRASLEINNIQVTDKNKPHRNIVEVGTIRFKMLWDGLLRAKVVVDDASILNIQALTQRKSPGYVVPPPPPEPDKANGTLEKVQAEVLQQTQKQLNGNFLGDLAAVLGGGDTKSQLAQLQNQLKSSGKIEELQKELNEKKKVWEQKLKEMPQGKEIEEIGKRAKALKFDTKNPSQFAKDLQEAQKIYKEAEGKVKLAEKTSKDLKGDMNTYAQAVKDIEKMIDEDLKDLQTKFKIPDVNAKEFSTQLFLGLLEKKLVSVRKYVEIGRKYMPPKKTKEQKLAEKNEQLLPAARGKGKTYRFPVTTGYPLFWLKHAALSSEVNASEYSGNMKGEIRDLTSDPEFLKKPTLLTLNGEFPKQGITGVDAKIILDHTTENAKDSLILKVASFPVDRQVLSDSKDVSLAINKAVGSSYMDAVFANEQVTMTMRNEFQKVDYSLESKEKIVKEIIGNVLKGIPMITVNADITGSFSKLNIGINSNLGEELSKGFKAQLQAKIDEAKASLRKLIDDKIGGEKAKLTADLNSTTGGLSKVLDGNKAELDKALSTAKNSTKGKGSPTKKLEDEGKKLLKQFGL